MDDDLRARLQRLVDRSPNGMPDVRGVVDAGRRARWRRRATAASVTAAVIVLTSFAIAAINPMRVTRPDPLTHEDEVFVPAQEGEPTYVLSDFEIYYPYRAVDYQRYRDDYCENNPNVPSRCETHYDQAAVGFRTSWATSKYPGSVRCRITLYDENGAVVGEGGFETASMTRVVPAPGKPIRQKHGFKIPVDVTGPPASAEGVCEASDYKPGPGIRFTFVGSEVYTPRMAEEFGLPDRIRLIFDVEHLMEHVDSRSCRMRVWFESGRIETGRFTTNTGEGREEFETGFPASDPVTDATIMCRTFRG